MVGPAVQRDAVAHLRAVMGLSERRACSIVGADRKMVRYRSRRPPDTELRARLRDLANERRRFGYRRLFILLRREGEPSGVNCIHRLYREEVRWSPFGGQIGGLAKLGSGLRYAAISMPAEAIWTSAGVCPPRAV